MSTRVRAFDHIILYGNECEECGYSITGKTRHQHRESECMSNINRSKESAEDFHQHFKQMLKKETKVYNLERYLTQTYDKMVQDNHQAEKIKAEQNRLFEQERAKTETCCICCLQLDENCDSPCRNGHFLHHSCIEEIRKRNIRRCPVCRASIFPYMIE